MTRLKWKTAQYLESRWWNWYLRNKNPNVYRQWKLNYWQNLLKTISNHIALHPNGTYLDLGCGPAGIFMALPGNITAVDPLIDKYQRDFPFCFHNLPGNVSFVAARAEDYESNQTFDIVFCINVINHVEDLSKAMHNLRNLCKSGGTLVISVDEHRHHLPHRIFRWLPLDILHPHQLLKNEFKSLLRSNGFELTFDTILKTGHIFQYRLWVAHLQHKPL